MACSWVSIGIVTRTVGLEVGTGRGGITRGGGTGAASGGGEAAAAGGCDGAEDPELALRSASGPDLSQATSATKPAMTSPRVEMILSFEMLEAREPRASQ